MAAQGGNRDGARPRTGQAGFSSKLAGMKFMQKAAQSQEAGADVGGGSSSGAGPSTAANAAIAAAAATTAHAAAAVATAAAAQPSSSAPAGEKKAMSSKLMGMRFMQRAMEKQKLQDNVQEQQAKDAEAHWVSPHVPGGKRCVVISERDPLPEVSHGRMSFKSFNPATEALQRQPPKAAGPAAPGSAEATGMDVTDADMASQLGKRPYQADHSKILPLRAARNPWRDNKRQKRAD